LPNTSEFRKGIRSGPVHDEIRDSPALLLNSAILVEELRVPDFLCGQVSHGIGIAPRVISGTIQETRKIVALLAKCPGCGLQQQDEKAGVNREPQ
jgi:hypothetical protein